MHARHPSTSTYTPPSFSPPSTPPSKSRQKRPPHHQHHHYALLTRRRRVLLALPILLLLLYLSPLHLPTRSTTKPSKARGAHYGARGGGVGGEVQWSRYAYTLYASTQAYLCNAVMVFESLERLGSRAERVLFYPEAWDDLDPEGEGGEGAERNAQLLEKARVGYGVDTVPVGEGEWEVLLGLDRGEEGGGKGKGKGKENGGKGKGKEGRVKKACEDSFMKFLAWSQTGYERIIHLDSDVELVGHLDELFFLPGNARVAMMRAYWLLDPASTAAPPLEGRDKGREGVGEEEQVQQRLPHLTLPLTSLIVVLQPSERDFKRLMRAAGKVLRRGEDRDWDMEILNRVFGDECLVLPHRGLGVLSGEFRTHDHLNYLGSEVGDESDERGGDGKGKAGWDAERILAETKLVHFSDWPLPKPWIMWPHQLLPLIMPKCKLLGGGEKIGSRGKGVSECKEKKVWMGLYDGFRRRRKEVCALLSAPAPEWPPRNGTVEWEWVQEMEGRVKGKGTRAGEKEDVDGVIEVGVAEKGRKKVG